MSEREFVLTSCSCLVVSGGYHALNPSCPIHGKSPVAPPLPAPSEESGHVFTATAGTSPRTMASGDRNAVMPPLTAGPITPPVQSRGKSWPPVGSTPRAIARHYLFTVLDAEDENQGCELSDRALFACQWNNRPPCPECAELQRRVEAYGIECIEAALRALTAGPVFEPGGRCPCGADVRYASGIGPYCTRTGYDGPCDVTAGPVAPPPELPKRDARELIEALRIRALALAGEAWERTATRDMMKEAAQLLEDLTQSAARPPASPPALEALMREWDAEVREHGIWTSGHSIAARIVATLRVFTVSHEKRR